MRLLLAIMAILALATTARADDPDDKNPTGALLLTSTGTVAAYVTFARADRSFAVSGVAWIVLPSLGHWYAHDWVSKGLVLRTLGVAGIALGAMDRSCEDEPCGGDFLILASVGVLITGTIWDIASAWSAADEYNAARARATLAPTVLATPSGPALGLGLSGTF